VWTMAIRATDVLRTCSTTLGMRRHFYIPARNSERPVMVARDIRVIAERFEVGAHTLNHSAADATRPCCGVSRNRRWQSLVGRHRFDFCRVVLLSAREVHERACAASPGGWFHGRAHYDGNIVSRPRDPFVSGATTQAFSHSRYDPSSARGP